MGPDLDAAADDSLGMFFKGQASSVSSCLV
jgi:hypothetical protein